MAYRRRVTDSELERKLGSSGGVLIRGPKACGKTESARQLAGSVVQMDQDEQVELLMRTAPGRLLMGTTPRLIDEWQAHPKIWDFVRHEIDARKKAGQFILTGSSNPEESVKMHSGAGRFTIVDMRTMSWTELGISSGKVSLANLLKGDWEEVNDERTGLEFIVEKIVKGGFPALIDKNLKQAKDLNRAYVELLVEVDMSRVSDVKRDSVKVRNLLRSLARHTATLADIRTLKKDILDNDNEELSRPTIYDYLDALERLMIIEDQPAWNTHIRSSASLRKSAKRHFTDPCLAVAVLGLDEKALLADLRFTGFLFESLVVHDLRVYAQGNDARVYHYRDSNNVEVDAIVQQYSGEWAAFEIKLGAGQVESAVENLQKFSSVVDYDKTVPPKSLNVITGTGISYRRTDGINIISLASLGA